MPRLAKLPTTHLAVLISAIALVLLLGQPGGALAQCPLGVDMGAECLLSSPVTASGTLSFGKTLHLAAGGVITVSPVSTGLTLNIAGSLIMDADSRISGDVSGSAAAATIVVNAGGDITMAGGNPGAIITSSQQHGSCTPAGKGGDISLLASGNVTMGNGSQVVSTSPCGKGKIAIAGVILNLDGLVLSEGLTTRGQGGPIDVTANCDLIVSPTGQIISKGRDPGADRVHLQGGCTVRILGLVASTGQAHTGNVDNLCKGASRPDKPDNSRACVEIWSGDTLLIDSVAPSNGEVHADTGFGGGVSGVGWIDIFAVNDITIVGDSAPPFAVHANQTLTNGHGGDIQVKSKAGSVLTTGKAIQASGTGAGSQGGTILLEAGLNAQLNAGTLEAAGRNVGGGGQAGGAITARAFNGTVTGAAAGKLDADGGGGQAVPKLGVVTLRGCGTPAAGDGVAYGGTVVPAPPTILADQCGGEPAFSSYVQFPVCICACVCAASFNPIPSPGGGLPNTIIRGQGLKQVTEVWISDDCNPAGTKFDKSQLVSQSDSAITIPGVVPIGKKVVVVSPGGSCCMNAPVQ